MSPALDLQKPTADAVKAENQKSIKALDDLLKKLTISKSQDEINESAQEIASLINGDIQEGDVPTKAFETIKAQMLLKKDALARERAADALKFIASHSTVSPAVEPYLVILLPTVLSLVADKQVAVKTAAEAAAAAIVGCVNANAVKAVVPHIITSLRNAAKWQEKIADLTLIEILCKNSPVQLSYRVPDLLPVVSEAMWDTKKEVKNMAYGTMEKLCALISNRDIEKFIPSLIKCIAQPENVPKTIHELGATTFVTDVHEPTLALMVPLLERGLAERETAIKRKAAVIVDNMCKLVRILRLSLHSCHASCQLSPRTTRHSQTPKPVKRPSKVSTP